VQNVGPAGASGLFVLLLPCNQMLINVCVVTSSKKKVFFSCVLTSFQARNDLPVSSQELHRDPYLIAHAEKIPWQRYTNDVREKLV
jgi:hypothetical protein